MSQTQPAPELRTRQHQWISPAADPAAAATMGGLDLLQAMQRGEHPAPPLASTLGFGALTVEPGRVVVELLPAEFHLNPLGTMHGGVIAALLDTACGCAVHSLLPPGVGYTSLDLSTRFLRPVTPETGPIRCVGTVLHHGRRTASAEASLLDGDGRLLAHATSTCMTFPLPEKPFRPDPPGRAPAA
jgi:uncharacterized protein (TIGR00369 family)